MKTSNYDRKGVLVTGTSESLEEQEIQKRMYFGIYKHDKPQEVVTGNTMKTQLLSKIFSNQLYPRQKSMINHLQLSNYQESKHNTSNSITLKTNQSLLDFGGRCRKEFSFQIGDQVNRVMKDFIHSTNYPELQHLQTAILQFNQNFQELEKQNLRLNQELDQSKQLIQYYQIACQQKEQMLAEINNDNQLKSEVLYQKENSVNQSILKIPQIHQVEKQKDEKLSEKVQIINPILKELQTNQKSEFEPSQSTQKLFKSQRGQLSVPDLLTTTKSHYNASSRQTKIFPDAQQNSSYPNYEQYKFVKHCSQYSLIGQLLNFDTSQEEINSHFKDIRELNLLWKITKDQETLLRFITGIDGQNLENLHESILYAHQYCQIYLKVILQLKQVIQVFKTLKSSFTIEEAFNNIIQVTCNILNCERASIFLADYQKNELWTQVAKDSDSTIRVPFNSGLVGHVLQSAQTLNILDAYCDNRFNPDIDQKMNYITKTVLTAPILSSQGNTVIGIIQAINQQIPFNQRQKATYFSKDDEGILAILGSLGQSILSNSLFVDEKLFIQNSLRTLFASGIQLNLCHTIKEFIIKAEYELQQNFDVVDARVFVFDERQNTLFRYNETGEKLETKVGIGITGVAFEKAQVLEVTNLYQHQDFNKTIDINSNLPGVFIPIFSPYIDTNINSKLGIICAIETKAISSTNLDVEKQQTAIKNKANLHREVLENFANLLSQTLYTKQLFNSKIQKATLIGGSSSLGLIDDDIS